jgi:ribonuclease PH
MQRTMARSHADDALRPVEVIPRFLERHPASVLYSSGATRVLCTATLEAGVPTFLEGRKSGWATAEYNLLPGSTSPRHPRERWGKVSGRTQEIQRFIGRSLRAILDLSALSGFTLQLDCDVLEADGGTRTAAVNGAYVAAELAARDALANRLISRSPVRQAVGAVSAGIVGGRYLLDLDYEEDSQADVDLNLVVASNGAILEVQATSEKNPFARADLGRLLDLGEAGVRQILEICGRALGR